MIKTQEHIDKNLTHKFEQIVGTQNVFTDKETRIMYATDSTAVTNDLYLCDYVIFPETTQQISEIMKIAYENSIPVTTRGAGTNMAGCCVPFQGGIVLALTKMNKIFDFDETNQTIKAQAGVVVKDLQDKVAQHGLFYPPDPSNLKVSTIGGSLALSSSGPRTFKYGGTKDYVLGLTVVLANGEIIKTGSETIKDVTGYNLTQLFVGSEGTLGIITDATFRLVPKPKTDKVMLVYFPKIDDAANAINSIITAKIVPSVLDIIDKVTMKTIENYQHYGFLTDNEAALFIEIDGEEDDINKNIDKIVEICQNNGACEHLVSTNAEEKEKLWTSRRASFGAIVNLRPNVISEDMVVPRSKMPDMIKKTYEIGEKYGLEISIVGHAGDGNFHPHIAFDLRDVKESQRVNAAIKDMFMCAIDMNGKISGEHGIGSVKAKYLKYSLDENAYKYMKMIKTLFDSKNILNPQKVFDDETR